MLIPVIVGNRPAAFRSSTSRDTCNLHLIHITRHDAVQPRHLTFGTLSVWSFNNKVDVVKQLRVDVGTDVLCVMETWHDDGDALPIRWLRCEGLQVVECAHPLLTNAKLDNIGFTNRGSVAIITPNNIRVAVLPLILSPSTFEDLCARITSRGASCVMLLVYRPGSQVVSPQFFTELTKILDQLSTLALPVILTGDVNIRLDRRDNPSCQQFTELLTLFDLFSARRSANA